MSSNFNKYYIFLIFFLILNIKSEAQFFNQLRIGGGIGSCMYLGAQMDAPISLNTFGKSEIKPGYNVQLYYAINNKYELGARFLNTDIWSFKSENTIGLNIKLNEFSLILQRSLLNNINMKYPKYTVNLAAGLGVILYRSVFYTIDAGGTFTPYSSVGKGAIPVASNAQITEQRPTLSGLVGLNLGYRLGQNFSIFFENSITLSGSNYITGKADTKYWQPNNGYFYSAISLYLNFNGRLDPLGCPKF